LNTEDAAEEEEEKKKEEEGRDGRRSINKERS